jgi:hypothetical protein
MARNPVSKRGREGPPGLAALWLPGTDPVRFAQGKLTGHWEERVSIDTERRKIASKSP